MFVNSVRKSESMYGSSNELLEQIEKCEQADREELDKEVELLCKMYLKEELLPIVKNIEDVCFEIYSNNLETARDYLEPFQQSLDSYIYIDDKIYMEI